MSEKFTPGPWHTGCFTDPESKCQCRYIIDEGYAGGIATVHMWNGINLIENGNNDAPKRDEAVANAHLIATAPRLYKALHTLLDELSALMGNSAGVAGLHMNGDLAPWAELEPGGQFEHLGSIDEAFSALAEARGET